MRIIAPAPIPAASRPYELDLRQSSRTIDRLSITRVAEGNWRFPSSAGLAAGGASYVVIYPFGADVDISDAGTESTVRSGDFHVLGGNPARSISARVGAELLLVAIPADAIGVYDGAIDAAQGMTISTDQGAASLVAYMLKGLAEQPDSYFSDVPGRLAQHVIGMIALMCAEAAGSEGGNRSKIFQDAVEYIESHLSDVDLTPDRVAGAHNVSTRTLHRIFENEGHTISGWTRARRLEHCRLDLVDPTHADIPVSSVGSRWGLWDAAHFSRLFKVSFGLSPRAYRDQHSRYDAELETA